MYNKGLTTATDLYGLGAMLIALLTQTKSTRMDALIDEDGKITFQHLTPKLSLRFVDWLEKMVAPRASDRYSDAASALAALKPIYVVRYPSVEFNQPSLKFRATQLGEKITQTIIITNPTPDTLLEGNWSIESHPHDPPQSNDRHHKWISFSSRAVSGNQVASDITIDTSKLISQAVGTRSIVLRSNAVPDTHILPLQIITAPLPVQIKQLPYFAISIFSIFAVGCGLSINNGGCWSGSETGMPVGFLSSMMAMMLANIFPVYNSKVEFKIYLGTLVGGVFGGWAGGWAGSLAGGTVGGWVGSIAGGISIFGILDGIIFGFPAMVGGILTSIFGFFAGSIINYSIAGMVVGVILGIQAGTISTIFEMKYARLSESRKYPQGFIFTLLGIIPFLGISLGIFLLHPNFFFFMVISGTIARLAYIMLYLPSASIKQMEAYRQREKYLIKL